MGKRGKGFILLLFMAVLMSCNLPILSGSTTVLYQEDFSTGTSLSKLGFTDITGWEIDKDERFMTSTAFEKKQRVASICTPRFKADRSQGSVILEWQTAFFTRKQVHGWEIDNKHEVSLVDETGKNSYSLLFMPNFIKLPRQEDISPLLLYKRQGSATKLLKLAFTRAEIASARWLKFRMELDSTSDGPGKIRVFGDTGDGRGFIQFLEVQDKSLTKFQTARFRTEIGRAWHKNRVGVDEIRVSAVTSGIKDTTPPVTVHDDKNDGAWVRQPAAIHLKASDEGSGVREISYQINEGQVMLGDTIEITHDGVYNIAFWATDNAGNAETPQKLTVKLDQTSPELKVSTTPAANVNGWHTGDVTVNYIATDNLSGVAKVTEATQVTGEGIHDLTGIAQDVAGNLAQVSMSVKIDKTPPVIGTISPANGDYTNNKRPTISVSCSDNLSGIDPAAVKMTLDGKTVQANVGSSRIIYNVPNDLSDGRHTVTLSMADQAGHTAPAISSTFTVEAALPPIPPDPATIAPKLNPTVATNTFDATKFLYTGENPIQTGIAPETIEPKRAAVIRGKVLDKDGQPLPGAVVSILNHPEYGQTVSRQDGMFDLAVNGGGLLTIKYERSGYLSAQRQVDVPWQHYIWAEDVCLVQLDKQVTTISLNSAESQIARGSVVTDKDGVRQATIFFPEGVSVEGYSGQTLNIRATEYTFGENGPKMMPAALPPSIGYTYCVEFSTDELEHVKFNKPIYFYVENFLNFPVGGIVPVGYYDFKRGIWVASDNGRVIKIINIINGLAEIDVNGLGQPASEEVLKELGFTDKERKELAMHYSAGQSLWRSPIDHFTPLDCNVPWAPPPNAKAPSLNGVKSGQAPDDDCRSKIQGASTIQVKSQVLGEDIIITGTPFQLHYSSDRVSGYKAPSMIDIPLAGDSIPSSVLRIDVKVQVAGKKYIQSYKPQINAWATFVWDGKDAFERQCIGTHKAIVEVEYVYQAYYLGPNSMTARAFGELSNSTATYMDRGEIGLFQRWETTVTGVSTAPPSVAGWSLDIHHSYDPIGGILYKGNGDRRTIQNGNVIEKFAGGGISTGDNGPATLAGFGMIEDIVASSDGSLYIADYVGNRIRKVDPDGTITTIAGGVKGFSGDGGLAINAQINGPYKLALGPDETLYFVDFANNRLRKITPDGRIFTVAGNGRVECTGDNGPAIDAGVGNTQELAVGPDGSIYLYSDQFMCIRKISTDGTIHTMIRVVAGYENAGDGGPVSLASIERLTGLAVGPDGSIYLSTHAQIRRITPDGIIQTIAGKSTYPGNDLGDGGSAKEAYFREIEDIVVGRDGSVYVSTFEFNSIRVIMPNGLIQRYAGVGRYKVGEQINGGLATQAQVSYPRSIAVGPNGEVYVASQSNQQISKIHSPIPIVNGSDYLLPSEDGNEIYHFDANGRHLETLSSLTKIVIYKFGYNAEGQLISVLDMNGNLLEIQRDNKGTPRVIIAPFGQKTTLVVNGNGYLSSVTNPAHESVEMTYYEGGLLSAFTNARKGLTSFFYDERGRIIEDTDPMGRKIRLTREEIETGFIVTETTNQDSETDNVKTYKIEKLPSGDSCYSSQGCCGGPMVSTEKYDGSNVVTKPDGTISTSLHGPDPRFGMLVPNLKTSSVKTPGGLEYTLLSAREVVLERKIDLFSLITQTDTITINGKTTTSVYDTTTRTITTTSPLGRKTVSTLDEKGRVIKTEVPGIVPVAFEYDARGRLCRTTEGTGTQARITEMKYNDQGYVESVIDPLLRTTKFEYDLTGRVTAQTLPNGKVIRFAYDANGNVTKLTPPGRPEHGFDYTPVDLEENYNPPMITGVTNGKTHTDYNLGRQPTLVTRPDGQTIGFEYDAMGRLVTLTVPEGNTVYVYDANTGQLKNIASPGGNTLGYSYDGSLSTQVAWGGTIQGNVGVTYDNFFRVKTQSINGRQTVNYGYDDDGLLTQAGETTIARDSQNGRMTGTTHRDFSESFGYNDFGEIQDYRATHVGTELFNVHYAMDKLGRIETKTETVGGVTHTYAYGYDDLGQLTDVRKDGVLIAHYDYDDNGNRTGGVYDDQDRMLQYGSNNYTYSANGELQEKVGSGGSTKYQYDVLGNLKEVLLPSGTKVEYLVDGANRRIGRKVNGVLVQGFLYQDALNPVAELDATGNVVTRFVYGTKGNIPDYMIKNGTTYRIVSDHLGSPRLVVDVATGNVVQRMDYDEFGNVTLDTNPGFQPFGFAGGIYDPETKLVRFGARDYDAETGRWTGKDPIGFGGGDTGLYGYCFNDPVNFKDSDGECAWIVAGAVIGAGLNMAMTYVANGGNVTTEQMIAAFVSGAVSGAIGAIAGPAAGTMAKSLGFAAQGFASSMMNAGISAAGGALGQGLSNAIDPCHSSSVGRAALFAGVGGGVASRIPVRGMGTLKQAKHFGPRNPFGLLNTANKRSLMGAYGVASMVGGASNF